jgi:hypothetical protein
MLNGWDVLNEIRMNIACYNIERSPEEPTSAIKTEKEQNSPNTVPNDNTPINKNKSTREKKVIHTESPLSKIESLVNQHKQTLDPSQEEAARSAYYSTK